MANYNDGYIYNADGGQGGFFYNGADFLLLLRLHDTIRTVDDIGMKFAMLVLNEQFETAEKELILAALVNQTEPFDFEDDMLYSSLFTMADEFGVKEELIDLIALAYLEDNQKILDDVRMIGNLISMDEDISLGSGRSRATFSASFHDEANLKALASIADRYGMKDNIDWVSLLHRLSDELGITDGLPNPKLAISDFLIGVTDGLDKSYDWFVPMQLKVDWNSTNIQIMPESEITSIEMPSIDGSIVEDTVYKDRIFQITAFSEQGLTIQEKEDLKTRITEILDSTKHQSKKLTVQSRGVTFESKYHGLAEIESGPSWIRATIPMRVSPYGQRSFSETVNGSGLVDNSQGDAPLGVTHIIEGPITNPSFSYGDIQVSYNGTILAGQTLTINHNMYTVYITDQNQVKHNALKNYNGQFYKVQKGRSAAIVANSTVASKLTTEYAVKVLW